MENGDQLPWKRCQVCGENNKFSTPADFTSHLRQLHCSREGGSFVCHYGYNRVCSSLPLEGVSDTDYEQHVTKHHVYPRGAVRKDVASRSSSVSSTGSSLSSQPSVVTDGLRWSLHHASQNIPALLTDPARGKQRDFFTKTWGEGFTEKEVAPSGHLPAVGIEDFETYLRSTSKRYRRHLKRSSSLKRRSASPTPAGVTNHAAAEDDEMSLSHVPRLFFDPTFDLARPDLFPVICPAGAQLSPARGSTNQSSAGLPSPGRSKQHSNRLLQEKLTHYLDIVEVQITRQIADKSEAFFDAMSSHDSLMDQLKQASHSVRTLRERMSHIRESDVTSALRVLRYKQRQQNHQRALTKLRLMSTVHQTQPTVQLLLSTSEFVGALDLIATSQEVLAQELSGLQAFRHLGSQLTEMERVIDKMVSAEFVRYVTSDLNRPLDQKQSAEEDQLVSIVFGMVRLKNFNLVDLYREEVSTTVRAVVKQTVIETLASVDVPDDVRPDGGASDGGALNEHLTHLPPGVWLRLLRDVCSNLHRLLTRVKAVRDMMEEVVDAAAGRPSSMASKSQNQSPGVRVSISETAVDVMLTGEEHERLRSSLASLLPSVSDHAHDCCAKLLQARVRDGSVECQDFLSLAALVRRFVDDCHQLCGRRSSAFQLALQSQASQFVQRFHAERRTKLNLLLESERWKQADVPAEFQTIADHVHSTGVPGLPSRVSCPESPERRPADVLRVGEERFAVVGTALMLVKILLEYCDCAKQLPDVSADLLTRLVELLRLFNSRCCQLVVGAGAIQLVGLKTITSRNLALAARCLQLVLHYLPSIELHFQTLLPERSRAQLKHVHQVRLDYTAHVQEIDTKLLSIISAVCDQQLNRWEARPPVPSQQFRAICRAVGKLHEATASVLTADHQTQLFVRLNSAFIETLRRHVTRLAIKKDGGPQHGLVTSELIFYQEHLRTLGQTPERPLAEQLWTAT